MLFNSIKLPHFLQKDANLKSELNNGKASTSHTHDDRYYTESEMDSKITTINNNIDYTYNNGLAWRSGTAPSNIDSLFIQGSYYLNEAVGGLPIAQPCTLLVFTPFGYNNASFCIQFYIPWNPIAFSPYIRLYTNNQWYGWREL